MENEPVECVGCGEDFDKPACEDCTRSEKDVTLSRGYSMAKPKHPRIQVHRHPKMQQACGVDDEHVIIDKGAYEKVKGVVVHLQTVHVNMAGNPGDDKAIVAFNVDKCRVKVGASYRVVLIEECPDTSMGG